MPGTYLINRDATESARLELQHTVWSRSLGYVIHPRIATTLPDNARIADVGTGTAIWLLDLAKSHPDWRLDGFDISDQAFPAPSEMPNNVKLSLHNLTDPFPEALHGQFDAVHLRLLLLALGPDDWARGLANVKTLLKPGGWIQWDEVNPESWTVGLRSGAASASQTSGLFPENISRAIEFAMGIGMASAGARNAHGRLHTLFRSNSDFKEVIRDVVSSDRLPELRADGTRSSVGVAFSMGKRLLSIGAEGAWSLEEMNKTMDGVEKEISEGGYCIFYMQVVLGRI